MAVIYTDKKDQLPTRHEFDFYRTPEEFARLGLGFLWDTMARDDPFRQPPHPGWAPTVLDPGAGDGVWGTALRQCYTPSVMIGVEKRSTSRPDAYDRWHVADFLQMAAEYEPACDVQGYTLVVGNPPYCDGEAFVRGSLKVLTPGGYLLFLLKLTFLQSKGRAEGLFQEHPPLAVAVCKKRPPFTGPGNTDSYAFYCWRKGYQGETTLTWV